VVAPDDQASAADVVADGDEAGNHLREPAGAEDTAFVAGVVAESGERSNGLGVWASAATNFLPHRSASGQGTFRSSPMCDGCRLRLG
jgi:hypothetical protein